MTRAAASSSLAALQGGHELFGAAFVELGLLQNQANNALDELVGRGGEEFVLQLVTNVCVEPP